MSSDSTPFGECPVPSSGPEEILLGHGSGGKLTARLIEKIILPAFRNPALERLDDQAILSFGGARLAFTTDSYVVTPIFFPGGDIGELAVNGTVNDLAMGGARPLYLSLAFILEEGLPIADLERVIQSVRRAAARAGVDVVTGDTKVVGRGSGDKIFINTSGIGLVPPGIDLSSAHVQPGDAILVSGPIGDHGVAILSRREGLEFDGQIESDTAPLHELVAAALAAGPDIHALRDPTRGGVAATLVEIATRRGLGLEVDESAVPVRDAVRGACEILGLDPLLVANEGKLVA
ncbi:MAG TPA: hydrogenase expression/formation protein HypE, partial [Myxococcales bacterium]|nr:hydrogenase expression/formation protein HypE [Myxococcales bacterium]